MIASALLSLLACTACESRLERDIREARADLKSLRELQVSLREICSSHKMDLNKAMGLKSRADFDIAAAENLDNISKSQEWDIRESIAARTGIAPSEVDGWKSVLEGRASNAKSDLYDINEKIKRATEDRDYVCGNLQENEKQDIPEARKRLLELIKESKRS